MLELNRAYRATCNRLLTTCYDERGGTYYNAFNLADGLFVQSRAAGDWKAAQEYRAVRDYLEPFALPDESTTCN